MWIGVCRKEFARFIVALDGGIQFVFLGGEAFSPKGDEIGVSMFMFAEFMFHTGDFLGHVHFSFIRWI